jgi:hypothetical protein
MFDSKYEITQNFCPSSCLDEVTACWSRIEGRTLQTWISNVSQSTWHVFHQLACSYSSNVSQSTRHVFHQLACSYSSTVSQSTWQVLHQLACSYLLLLMQTYNCNCFARFWVMHVSYHSCIKQLSRRAVCPVKCVVIVQLTEGIITHLFKLKREIKFHITIQSIGIKRHIEIVKIVFGWLMILIYRSIIITA